MALSIYDINVIDIDNIDNIKVNGNNIQCVHLLSEWTNPCCPQIEYVFDKHTLPAKAVTCRDGWEVQISEEMQEKIKVRAKWEELLISLHTDEKIDQQANGNPALTMTLTMWSSHSSTISMSVTLSMSLKVVQIQCSTQCPGQLMSLAMTK